MPCSAGASDAAPVPPQIPRQHRDRRGEQTGGDQLDAFLDEMIDEQIPERTVCAVGFGDVLVEGCLRGEPVRSREQIQPIDQPGSERPLQPAVASESARYGKQTREGVDPVGGEELAACTAAQNPRARKHDQRGDHHQREQAEIDQLEPAAQKRRADRPIAEPLQHEIGADMAQIDAVLEKHERKPPCERSRRDGRVAMRNRQR